VGLQDLNPHLSTYRDVVSAVERQELLDGLSALPNLAQIE
jgi:hypothetical protein